MTRFVVVLLSLCILPAHATGQRVLNVGDATLRYDVAGEGAAVVFIHGWAQSLEIWEEQARAFTPAYRVVRYDRRGFGQAAGHADASADPADLRALLDTLGIRAAHIVGLSAGATVALDFAAAFPDRVRGLVLYGMPPVQGYPSMPHMRPRDIFGDIARRYGMDSVRRMILASPLVWVPTGRQDLRDAMRAAVSAYGGRDLLDPQPESGRVPHAQWDQLRDIRVPTLIVNGDHDLPEFLVFAEAARKQIPNARQVIIQDGGHGAHFAQPQQFNKALRDFFASLSR